VRLHGILAVAKRSLALGRLIRGAAVGRPGGNLLFGRPTIG